MAEKMLSIQEVADRLGVSYATIYKRVRAGEIRHVRHANGAVEIPAREVAQVVIAPRVFSDEKRRAVQLRPPLSRYEAWASAAGDRSVSTWLGELADRAAARKGAA